MDSNHSSKETDKGVSAFKRNKLEKEAQKNWDIFYKRNADAFFKDRNWTRDEFAEIFTAEELAESLNFLEIGCGVGNMLFPVAEFYPTWKLCGADFAKNAIELVNRRAEQLGITARVSTMVADITLDGDIRQMEGTFPLADIASLIFVLSSISPEHHLPIVRNLRRLIKPGGSIIVRDYACMDGAMLRFSSRSKIAERFYTRIDGTRAYFFTKEELAELFQAGGFDCARITYLNRKTVNRKKQLDVDRVFVQGRFIAPIVGE